MFKNVDPELMHTKIKVRDQSHADELLAGAAFATARATLDPLRIDTDRMLDDLHRYTSGILQAEIRHTPDLLNAFLKAGGR
jgi:hypothetical protein